MIIVVSCGGAAGDGGAPGGRGPPGRRELPERLRRGRHVLDCARRFPISIFNHPLTSAASGSKRGISVLKTTE
jgi:hypothetical protein